MKFLVCLLVCTIMTAQESRAAYQCENLFSDMAWREAQKGIRKIERLEGLVTKLQDYNGGVDRRTQAEMRMRVIKLGFYLSSRQINPIFKMYRQVFRNAELALAKVPDIDVQLEAGNLNEKERKALVKERRRLLRRFGASYGEYIYVREILRQIVEGKLDVEDISSPQLMVNTERVVVASMMDAQGLANGVNVNSPTGVSTGGRFNFLAANERTRGDLNPADPISQETARKVMDGLGITDLQKLWPDAGLGEGRPSVADIETYFRSQPEARLGMLWSAFRKEAMASVRYTIFENEILNSMKRVVGRMPPVFRKAAEVLLFFEYDLYLKTRYADSLEQYVIRHPFDNEGRVRNLIGMNEAASNDEVIYLFARIIERNESWQVLKRAAQAISIKENASIYEKQIFKKMEYAEKRAKDEMYDEEGKPRPGKGISLIFDRSYSQALSVFVWAALWSVWDNDTRAFYSRGLENASNQIKRVKNLVPGIGGGSAPSAPANPSVAKPKPDAAKAEPPKPEAPKPEPPKP